MSIFSSKSSGTSGRSEGSSHNNTFKLRGEKLEPRYLLDATFGDVVQQ